jgi:non-specific serine/threonine protein kinase
LVATANVHHAGADFLAEANCLRGLAEAAALSGDDAAAREWAMAAVARASGAGWTIGVAVAHRVLAGVCRRQGDRPTAAALLKTSLTESRRAGARWSTAETLGPLAELALEDRDVRRARVYLAECLELAQDMGDRARMAVALEGFARVAAFEREPRRAVGLIAVANTLRDAIQSPRTRTDQARLDQIVGGAPRALGERAVARLVARGLTNRQIGAELVIAEGTAERHVANIMGKLNVGARSQIAAWAVAQGLLETAHRT